MLTALHLCLSRLYGIIVYSFTLHAFHIYVLLTLSALVYICACEANLYMSCNAHTFEFSTMFSQLAILYGSC